MQRIGLCVAAMLLAGCARNTMQHNDNRPDISPLPAQATENLGEQVVRDIRMRYADTRYNCGAQPLPAYRCNGVLIRGTVYSPSYHAWNNSPDAHLNGGVSFAYLRSDAVFRSFNITRSNGYIFQAYDLADAAVEPEVLCAFPIDGMTWLRDAAGCGMRTNYPDSGPCQAQGIHTAQEWWRVYSRPEDWGGICGFDVRLALGAGAWRGFDENIKARNLMPAYIRNGSNELRLKVWEDQDGSTLPLQAFFYFAGRSSVAREQAMLNQQDLKVTADVTVPVIAVVTPPDPDGQVTFEYRPEDQAVPMPFTSSDAPASPLARRGPAALDQG